MIYEKQHENAVEIVIETEKLSISALNFGARLHKVYAKDRLGNSENVVLAKEDFDTLATDTAYYGAICGPVAGRIKGATYADKTFTPNNHGNLLHGGIHGWGHKTWTYETFETPDASGVTFTYHDTLSGFGEMIATTTYTVKENTLCIQLSATAIEDTLFNPANHAYFNLTGKNNTTIHKHHLTLSADKYMEVDDLVIPTGNLLNVENTPYDFREGHALQESFHALGHGIDDCFLLEPVRNPQRTNLSQNSLESESANRLNQNKKPAMTLIDPDSGRKMTCFTDRDAVVLYTCEDPETTSTVNGAKMAPCRGIAVEFQELNDIVHHPEWGNIELKAGETKTFETTYHFDVI